MDVTSTLTGLLGFCIEQHRVWKQGNRQQQRFAGELLKVCWVLERMKNRRQGKAEELCIKELGQIIKDCVAMFEKRASSRLFMQLLRARGYPAMLMDLRSQVEFLMLTLTTLRVQDIPNGGNEEAGNPDTPASLSYNVLPFVGEVYNSTLAAQLTGGVAAAVANALGDTPVAGDVLSFLQEVGCTGDQGEGAGEDAEGNGNAVEDEDEACESEVAEDEAVEPEDQGEQAAVARVAMKFFTCPVTEELYMMEGPRAPVRLRPSGHTVSQQAAEGARNCPVSGVELDSHQPFKPNTHMLRLMQELPTLNQVDADEVTCSKTFLARGVEGCVYKGECRGQEVAVKVVNVDYDSDESLRETWETVMISHVAGRCRIRHDVCVNELLAVSWTEGEVWMVQPCYDEDLVTLVDRTSTGLPPTDVAALLLDLLTAMLMLHDYARIVHSNIKPNNVLLHDRRVRLADFGIATMMQTVLATRNPASRFGRGAPGYAAPEQDDEGAPASPAMDVFGIGATALYAATRQHPYNTTNRKQIYCSIGAGTSLPVPDRLPSELKQLLEWMVQVPKEDRPSMQQAQAHALQVFLALNATAAPVHITPADPRVLSAPSRPLPGLQQMLRTLQHGSAEASPPPNSLPSPAAKAEDPLPPGLGEPDATALQLGVNGPIMQFSQLPKSVEVNASYQKPALAWDATSLAFDRKHGWLPCDVAHVLRQLHWLKELHFPSLFVSAEDARVLSWPLAALTRMTHLDLNQLAMSPDASAALLPALRPLTGLLRLTLAPASSNQLVLGDSGAVAAAKSLSVLTRLTRLDLKRFHPGSAGALAMGRALSALARLQELSLQDLKCLPTLKDSFEQLTSLTELSFVFSYMGNEGLQVLAPGMKYLTGIRTLNIGRNAIGDEGAAVLARVLPCLSCLETLYLFDNHINVDGVGSLVRAFTHLGHLKFISLAGNPFGDEGFRVMCVDGGTWFSHRKMIVDVRSCRVGFEAAQAAMPQSWQGQVEVRGLPDGNDGA